MTIFLQFLFSGLTVGSVYALIGMGFTIIYNATSIINLAQGEFVVIGGFLMWFFLESCNVPFPAAIALTPLIAGMNGSDQARSRIGARFSGRSPSCREKVACML